jgi:ligand-binding sensor domain-containing protein
MLQDASGYLWFTTDMGVSRFNGYEFKNFSTENGLADNTNFGLTEDAKGRIWFRSFSGKLSYYENEKIKTPACNSGIKALLPRKMITSLYVDEGDTIWIGLNKNEIIKISPPWKVENMQLITLPAEGAYLILFSEKDFIYGGSSPAFTDLTVYNGHLKKLYEVPIHITPVEMGHIRYSYALLSDHTYAITANSTVARFNSSGILSRKENSSIFIALLETENKNIFTGTYDGVRQYSDYAFTDAGMLPHLDKKVITAISRDHENGLWFCTEGNGVFYIPFQHFRYYSPVDGLSESKISCVAKAGNKVICGHLDGTISILRQQNVRSIHFNPDTFSTSSANRTTTMAYDGHDQVYIGTIKNIFTFNLASLSTDITHTNGTKMLIPASDGGVWSLQFNNLIKYSAQSALKVASRIELNTYTDNIYEDRSGKVWICPTNSVWTWSAATGITDEGKKVPLLNTRIVDVQEDNEGNIWMVSRGSGVILKKGNNYFNITQQNGLAGNMCKTVFIDSGNVVWVGTNNGLSKIQLEKGNEFRYSVTTYSSKNGLLTNEVNDILRHENKLWLIHNNGVSIFDPADIRNNDSPPPVYISGLIVNEEIVPTIQSQTFSYNENYFNISFIGLSYKDPGHLQYRYKMEGIDSNWIYTPYTSVKYQTLPPGDYRFVVSAKNNDDYWSKDPAVLSFTISPAWWQTWIFKIIIAFVLLMLIFFIFRVRINIIRKRDQKKSLLQNRIAAIELNALRAQMNPHFVFNSINSVQYFITNNDPDSSQKYLSKFAKLIRYVVDNSKLTSIPVKKEIEALTLYLELEALRFGKHFEYEINVHPNVDTEYTQIPSMLIQPYVENSIWHGIMHKKGNGKIDISLEMKERVLYCMIQDNGIGRKRSMELKHEKESLHQSVGMSNTRERLEIINQVNNSDMSVVVSDLLDEKGEIAGTKVEIHIPIS